MRPIRSVFPILALTLAAVPGAADELLGEFQAWDAATAEVDGNKVCFMTASPEKEEGDYSARGEVAMFVTHWPQQGKRDEVSVKAGYTYKDGSWVTLTIGGASWQLWTDGQRAWAYDDDQAVMVRTMKAGLDMVVKGTSSRGTLTTDTYSLEGFTAAYNAISKACGG